MKTANRKNLLLSLILIVGLAFANNHALKQLPERKQAKPKFALQNDRKDADLILMGNSVMYTNLGDDPTLISEELSKLLNRPVKVAFISAGGVRSDWIYLMLRDYLAVEQVRAPIIWFYWTGLPFEPGLKTESNLRSKDQFIKQLAKKDTETKVQQEVQSQEEDAYAFASDYFHLGAFFYKHLFLYRVAEIVQDSFRHGVQQLMNKLLSPFFPTESRETEQILRDLFKGLNPMKANQEQLVPLGEYNRLPIKQAINDFEKNRLSSFMPDIATLVHDNHLDFHMLEVTTKDIILGKYQVKLHFDLADFSFDDFYKYRELELNALRQFGIEPISLIGNSEITEDIFQTHVYYKPEHQRKFARIIAAKIVEGGLLKSES